MRIVIGEDSVLVRAGAVRLLEDAGLEVVGQAGDGEELLRKVRAHVMRLMAQGTEGVGYLLKDRIADIDRLLEAVVRVANPARCSSGGRGHMLGRRRPSGPLDTLTPRESEVLGLMAEGNTNRAIADQMVVTERAIERHVTSIFEKLGLVAGASGHRRVLAVLVFQRA